MGYNEHRMVLVTFSSAEKFDSENRDFSSQKCSFKQFSQGNFEILQAAGVGSD